MKVKVTVNENHLPEGTLVKNSFGAINLYGVVLKTGNDFILRSRSSEVIEYDYVIVAFNADGTGGKVFPYSSSWVRFDGKIELESK